MNSALQKLTFLRLLLPFSGGVILQETLRAEEGMILILMVVSCITLLLWMVVRRSASYRWSFIFGILMNVVFFFAGMSLTKITIPVSMEENIRLGTIRQIPEEKSKTMKIILGNLREKASDSWYELNGKALVYIEKNNRTDSLEPGDILVFSSKLEVIKGPLNPMEFDFRQYCNNLGIYWQTYLGDSQWKKINQKASILSATGAEWIRMKLIRNIEMKNFRYAGLINSILLGYREELSVDQQKYFITSGAMHILAVSGLHVGIIYGALVFVLRFIFRKRTGYILLLPLPVVWGYALITGLTPSISRAAVMITLYVISGFLHRRTDSLNIILASAFLLTVGNPSVLHQVSFQLSFAAVIGISLVFPGLYRKLKSGNWFLDQIISITCLSMAAQLFTFPASLYYFHQFPAYFLVTNLIAVPLSAIILITGFIFLIFSFSSTISLVPGKILDWLTGALDHLTAVISNLPFSSLTNISLDIWEVCLIYLTILSLAGYFRTKSIMSLYQAFFCLILIFGYSCRDQIRNLYNREFMVLSIPGTTAINFISGKENLVMTDDTSQENLARIRNASSNHWCFHGLKDAQYIPFRQNGPLSFETGEFMLENLDKSDLSLIQFCEIRIGIQTGDGNPGREVPVPLHLDLLIIDSGSVRYQVEWMKMMKPGKVLTGMGMTERMKNMIKTECIRNEIPYHDISREGCLQVCL